jgi:hypothetical protein
VAGVDLAQAKVPQGIKRHGRNHSHAEAARHIGLNYVGIERRHHDVGALPVAQKPLLNPPASGESQVVGDEGPSRKSFDVERLLKQRMVKRHHCGVVPLVVGNREQFSMLRERFGGDPDLRLAA